jgi:hypothetical protein
VLERGLELVFAFVWRLEVMLVLECWCRGWSWCCCWRWSGGRTWFGIWWLSCAEVGLLAGLGGGVVVAGVMAEVRTGLEASVGVGVLEYELEFVRGLELVKLLEHRVGVGAGVGAAVGAYVGVCVGCSG